MMKLKSQMSSTSTHNILRLEMITYFLKGDLTFLEGIFNVYKYFNTHNFYACNEHMQLGASHDNPRFSFAIKVC
jgi:hypothetical protein